MSRKSRKYTAQEMRDMGEQILFSDDGWYDVAGHMLLQAADTLGDVERLSKENEHLGDARRNCDRYRTYKEADKVWWSLDIRKRLKYRYDMAEWLFDKVEEGGAE